MKKVLKNNKEIVIVSPSFGAGGAERVLSELANYFVKNEKLIVHFIILIGGEQFYDLDKRIKVYKPTFDYKNYNRITFTLKIIFFLRSTLKRIGTDTILSFGGRYNSFVLLSCIGLDKKVFISDRSRPSISYGRGLDILNRILYKKAAGIIAQTALAKKIMYASVKHNHIEVVGNPIRVIPNTEAKKEKIILNVGRFISSKNQELLIDYFTALNLPDWKLVFLGEGSLFEKVQNSSKALKYKDNIIFKGNVIDIDNYYAEASIFAFTSTSEGFPNALGEAMSAGMSCISFDCEAGPADLIDNGVNGFLIKNNDHDAYKLHLKKLCSNEELRYDFGKKAIEKMKNFKVDSIAKKFYDFIFTS